MKAVFREVDVYENERYSPLTGFGASGLLLTDRQAFSDVSGASCYATLEQVNAELLSTGWMWAADETWRVEPTSSDGGWQYAVDFGGDEASYAPTKGMAHFVRRRRLVRTQVFHAEPLLGPGVPWVCDFVDLDKVATLEKQLLAAVVSCSLQKHPRTCTDSKVNPIKNLLVAQLNLGPDSGGSGPALGMDGVLKVLEGFAGSGSSIWSLASGLSLSAAAEADNEEKRVALFRDRHFRLDEREALANAIVHKHDVDFQYHCRVPNCGSAGVDCPFAPVRCGNKGCEVVFSKKWGANHDATCPHKVVDCTRGCGEAMPRRLREDHLARECVLRPVLCPFAALGCDAGQVLYKDLAAHMDAATQPHLLLALTRLQEQQQVLGEVGATVRALDGKMAAFGTQIAGLTAGAAALATQAEASEKKVLKALHDEVGRVDAKAAKKVSAMEAHVGAELQQVKRAVQDLVAKETARTNAEKSRR